MARQPKLRKKKVGKATCWFTKAGGDTDLGNIEDVPFLEARKRFNEHSKSIAELDKDSKGKGLTA